MTLYDQIGRCNEFFVKYVILAALSQLSCSHKALGGPFQGKSPIKVTIKEQLAANLKEAMRARDKAQINVIRQIEAEVLVQSKEPSFTGEIDDDLYLATIQSYVKKMKKARQEYEAAGERGVEQAAKLTFEIDYLAPWLPVELDETATRELVRAAIAELGVDDVKQAGRVMGHIMKGGADLDGGLVNRLVREELGA
jgi:uncharacterized protein YqeY